ncbi:hypothetical protein F5B19DRAFT_458229 [Rostrohypoxylon terebratum]|nr:hypothetical protein F5B19DRAFT_458229 [Rostrohypoxylon terebratum]
MMAETNHHFPLDEAPDPSVRGRMEEALKGMNVVPSPISPWVHEDGNSFRGPYAALSYSSSVIQPFFAVGKTLYDAQVCKPRNRELAILALSSIVRIPLVVTEHRRLAAKLGITDEQYEDGLCGQVPRNLSEEENIVFRLGRKLVRLECSLDSETWNEANEKMEKSEIVGVVHVVSGYRWLTLLAQLDSS